MVGMLDRGQGDLGIGNLFLTSLRKDAISYSNPYDAEVGQARYVYEFMW